MSSCGPLSFENKLATDILIPLVPQFVKTVGGEPNGIARIKPHNVLVVRQARETPDGHPRSPSRKYLSLETSTGSGSPAFEKVSCRVTGSRSA
jgi:hypothetical protein